jgi:hypothetical protein
MPESGKPGNVEHRVIFSPEAASDLIAARLASNRWAMIEQRAAHPGYAICPRAGQTAEKSHKFAVCRLIWAGTRFA